MTEEKTNKEESPNASITEEVRSYVEKRFQLFVLTVTERVSHIIAHSLQRLMGMILLGFALYFVFLALGFYIGELLGNYSYGFAIVSLPFLLIGFVLLKRKSKRITEKIQADIIEKMILDIGESKQEKAD